MIDPDVSLAENIQQLDRELKQLADVVGVLLEAVETPEEADAEFTADSDRGIYHGLQHVDSVGIEREIRALEGRVAMLASPDAMKTRINGFLRNAEDRLKTAEERVREALGEAWEKPEKSVAVRLDEHLAKAHRS